MRSFRQAAFFLALFTALSCLFACGSVSDVPPATTDGASDSSLSAPTTEKPAEAPPLYSLLAEADDAFVQNLCSVTQAKIAAILSLDSMLQPADGGKIYYVSETSGNDKNDGLSPETAWKTLERVIVKQRKTIQPGDVVAFEKGGTYRAVDVPFEVLSGVTYTAWGEGPLPIITSSPGNAADPSFWKQTEENPNVWKCTRHVTAFGVGNIVFNGGEAQGIPVYLEYYDEDPAGPAGDFFTGLPYVSYADLSMDGQFRYCRDEVKNADILYLYSSKGNPGEIWDSIEFCREINVISCNGKENVTLRHLSVRYGGRHGIVLNDSRNITVENCEVAYIGGAVSPYQPDDYRRWEDTLGNGIEVYGSCDGFFVKGCYIHHVVDEAITTQHNGGASMLNLHYTDNVITHCRQAVSLWGASEANVLEFSRNDCWYTGYGAPTEHRIRFGEDGGVIELDTKGLELELFLKDNLVAFSRIVMVQLDPYRQGFTFSGNTYLGEDSTYVTVGGVTYHWDDRGGAALQNGAGDKDAALYVYKTKTYSAERTAASMTIPTDVKAGDTVHYGVYEQDGNSGNGAEALEWIVLEVKDGRALLLSEYVLECLYFYPREGYLGWRTSSIREFLEGDFIDRAFTAEEAARLSAAEIGMGGSSHTGDGETEKTASRVFILSAEELFSYLGEDGLAAEPTAYAASLKDSMQNMPVKDGYAAYWVRNFGKRTKFAGCITTDGIYDEYGAIWNSYANRGIRPAMWVTLG